MPIPDFFLPTRARGPLGPVPPTEISVPSSYINRPPPPGPPGTYLRFFGGVVETSVCADLPKEVAPADIGREECFLVDREEAGREAILFQRMATS